MTKLKWAILHFYKQNLSNLRNTQILIFFTMIFILVNHAVAQVPTGITIQGTILNPAGLPLESASVQFTVKIYSPGLDNCLLYSENHLLNMNDSGGTFSLIIGEGSRSGTGYQATSTLMQVFNNSSGVINSLTCTIGTSYTPGANDSRVVEITFNDGGGPQTISQTLSVQSVPYSMHAENSNLLQGKSSSDFIQVNTTFPANLTQANLEDIFSNTNFSRLQSMLAVSPTNYVKAGSNGSASIPSVAGDPSSGLGAGQIWYDSTNNVLKYHNGTSVETLTNNSSVNSLLPSQTGNSGKFLTTNGTNTSWGNMSGDNLGNHTATQAMQMAGYLINGNTTANGNLILDSTSNATKGDVILNPSGGKVGVGVSSPATKLEVGGTIKVGDSGESCTVSTKGAIRYNNSSSVLEFCNGTSWNLVQAAACSDATPATFTFSDLANQTISTQVSSNIVAISGFNCTLPLTISGVGSPQFRICSDSGCTSVVQDWTSAPGSIVSGQYLQLQQTTDAAGGASRLATVLVGGTAGFWTVSNAGGDCVGTTPPVGTICSDGTVFAGMSPDGNVKMFTTRCDFGQTWNGSACTGSRQPLTWNNGTSNWTWAGASSNTTGKANSALIFGLSDAGAPYQAVSACENLVENSQSDWYLPARSEAEVLAANATTIGNFSGQQYITSTEHSSEINAVLYVFIPGGSVNRVSKGSPFVFRCVRR